MEVENQSLIKLKSIARFLKASGRFNFQNYNLSLFINFLKEDPQISAIINNLLNKYSAIKTSAKEALEKGTKPRFDSFERWVAFCLFYIEEADVNQGNKVIDNFIIKTGVAEDDEGFSPKLQFYNDCIEPIIIYIELQIKHSLSSIYILQRYKILCEWYERDKLFQEKELEITQQHLSKYLFDHGFTYSLSETTVPSGRVDNFAISIGLKDKKRLASLPNAIIAEGKIFTGNKKDILDVMNQAQKRIMDLSFNEGFCVIFNKTKKNINLLNISGQVQGIPYLKENSSRVYFIVINLDEVFRDSKASIQDIDVSLK